MKLHSEIFILGIGYFPMLDGYLKAARQKSSYPLNSSPVLSIPIVSKGRVSPYFAALRQFCLIE
jgi:hypothetical protein